MTNLEKLKDYLKFNSFYSDLEDDDVTVHIEVWGRKSESNKLKKVLEELGLEFEYDFEEDGGHDVHMFDVNRSQIDDLLK